MNLNKTHIKNTACTNINNIYNYIAQMKFELVIPILITKFTLHKSMCTVTWIMPKKKFGKWIQIWKLERK